MARVYMKSRKAYKAPKRRKTIRKAGRRYHRFRSNRDKSSDDGDFINATLNRLFNNEVQQEAKKVKESKDQMMMIDTFPKGNKVQRIKNDKLQANLIIKNFSNEHHLVHLSVQQNKKSDQKSVLNQKIDKDIQKLNHCCMFCNNKLVYEAVAKQDVALVKKLLSDVDQISNPFQYLSYFNRQHNALSLACQLKNKDIIKLFIKELRRSGDRAELPETLLQKFDTGHQGYFNFNFRVAQVNQARGSKEGNDAFLKDADMRTIDDEERNIEKNLPSIEFLQEYMSEDKNKDKNRGNDAFSNLQRLAVEYVRLGMVKEALLILKHDFDNSMSDLNRLYVGALSGELPENIVRISITKQSKQHKMLSPLHCAAINPNPAIIKTLMRITPIFSLPDFNRRNIIHYAAANPNPEIIRFLLSNNADPNELDSKRKTPLMIASSLGRLENIKAILDHFEEKKRAVEKAAQEAAKKRKQKLALMRKKKKAKVSKKKQVPKKAGKRGRKLEESEEEDEDEEEEDEDMDEDDEDNDERERLNVNFLELKDSSSWTALNYAAYNGLHRCTPVLNAAARGHLEVIKILHKNDADFLGKVQKQKKNALIMAASNGHENVVQYILDNNLVGVNLADTSGNSPLHYAAAYGWISIAKLLILKGADLNAKNLWNSTPASIAIQKGHYKILEVIIEQSKGNQASDQFSDANGRDIVVQHLLTFDLNSLKQFETLINLFKRVKLQPNQQDQQGFNAFHYLAAVQLEKVTKQVFNSNQYKDIEEEKNSKKKSSSDDENDDDNSDDGENEDMEDNEDENDQSKQNKKERKLQKIYELLSSQVIQIANLLEYWGYGIQTEGIDGTTPLYIAFQSKNVPLIQWLLKRQNGFDVTNKINQRNILHWYLKLLVSDKRAGDQILKSIGDQFLSTNKNLLKSQSKQLDIRGFSPLNFALSYVMYKLQQNSRDKCPNSMIYGVQKTLAFFKKIDPNYEAFGIEVPTERSLSKNLLGKQEGNWIRFENDKYQADQKWYKYNKIYYNQDISEIENPKIFSQVGVIDFRFFKKPENHSYQIGYNTLHYLSQIVVYAQKDYDCSTLLEEIKSLEFKKLGNLLIKQNMFNETPIQIASVYYQLYQIYLENLTSDQLKSDLNGFYEDGNIKNIHLLSLMKNVQTLDKCLSKLDNNSILKQDSAGNSLLHYACYHRNTDLVQLIVERLQKTLVNYDKNLENLRGNNPLHLAVSTKSPQLELPKIEEILLSKIKKIGLAQNLLGQNSLHIALIKGSEYKADPINFVKMIIEKEPNILSDVDYQQNTPLHVASKLENIQLSFSQIFTKTKNRNSLNLFQNTPLTEAILNNQGVIYEENKLERIGQIKDYEIQSVNIQKYSLKNNFFGLYHFSNDGNNSFSLLEGALLAKNYNLFNQLLPNYSKSQVYNWADKNGRTLMHALAQSIQDDRFKEKNQSGDGEEDNEDNEDQDNDEENNGSNQHFNEQQLEQIFNQFAKEKPQLVLQPDLEGISPLILAIQSSNLKFVSLIFKHLSEKINSNQRLQHLHNPSKLDSTTFFSELVSSSNKISEKVQLRLLQEANKLIPNFVKQIGGAHYKYKKEDLVNDKKMPYERSIRNIFFPSENKKDEQSVYISPIFDLIEAQRYDIIRFLINQKYDFKDSTEKQTGISPMIYASLYKDAKMVKILYEEGKQPLDQRDRFGQTIVAYALNNYQQQNSSFKNLNYSSQSIEIINYVINTDKNINDIFNREINSLCKEKNFNNESAISIAKLPYQSRQPPKNNPASIKQQNIMKKRIEEDFQKLINKSNDNQQRNVIRPSLIDKKSKMDRTHDIVDNMSAFLMKADIKQSYYGLLRFYIVQLLKEKTRDHYVLWTRWGRVGEDGQNQRTPFASDIKGAEKEFRKIFKQKSGYDFDNIQQEQKKSKYRVIFIGDQNLTNNIRMNYKAIKNSIQVNRVVQDLQTCLEGYNNPNIQQELGIMKEAIQSIIIDNLDYSDKWNYSRKMNASLTTDQIAEAQDILDQALKLKAEDKSNKNDKEKQSEINDKLMELSNKYYSLIPTQGFSFSKIADLTLERNIKSEQEKLQEIYDFSYALKLSLAAIQSPNPLEYVRNALPIKLQRMQEDKDFNEIKTIMRYLNQGMLTRNSESDHFQVSNIFRVNEDNIHTEEDNKIFNNIHNHWLLWHGTKNENIIGILSKGMRIKPVSANHHGSLFGDAIYFADTSTKSLDQYFYLLLCEVALGNVSNYPNYWESEIYRPPLNSHSVRIMGQKGPDFRFNSYDDYGIVIPSGPIINYPPAKVEKGNKVFKDFQNFADFLQQQIDQEKKSKKKQNKSKKQAKRKAVPKNNMIKQKKKGQVSDDEDMESDEDDEDEDMEDNEEEEKDFGEDENIDQDVDKQLQKSFLNIKERKFGVQPHILTADYFMNRMKREIQDMNQDQIYREDTEYLVYTEQQVRIRYLVQLKIN